MKRKYLRTFFSVDTANDYNKKFVLNLQEDQDDLKSEILLDHPDTRRGWGDELLKPRTLSNWERWEEEKPAWFTDKWVDAVLNE